MGKTEEAYSIIEMLLYKEDISFDTTQVTFNTLLNHQLVPNFLIRVVAANLNSIATQNPTNLTIKLMTPKTT